jgi:hypothetical protein
LEFQRNPKKSRNLIAVLCCFCEWFDFGVFAVSGWGCGQRGRSPSRLMFLLVIFAPFGVVVKRPQHPPQTKSGCKKAKTDANIGLL